LITADKKDSQGLCFIGKVRLPEFLQQKLQPKEGFTYEIEASSEIYSKPEPNFESKEEQLKYDAKPIDYAPEMGKILGKHQGAHYFTNGQRKGLNIGGTKEGLFVIATNVTTNSIYTGQTANHPGLLRKVLFVEKSEVHWIREDLRLNNNETMEVMARIRYRQPLQKAVLYQYEDGMYIEFDEPQSAMTSGQFVAWNIDDELVGSGVIA
jgi:tRNA-uridine 2-sulfurtransferase